MEFVNSIAKIVHTEVALHGGAANKNIGDAFLLVWKFPNPAKAAAARSRMGSVSIAGGGSPNGSFSSGQQLVGNPVAAAASAKSATSRRSLLHRLDLSQRVLRKHSVQVTGLPMLVEQRRRGVVLADVKYRCKQHQTHVILTRTVQH